MDVGLDNRGIQAHLAPADDVLLLGHRDEAVVQRADHARPQRDTPTAHRLGVRDLATADAREVAIHQIPADFAFHRRIAPISHVFQHEQSQYHFGGRRVPATGTALGMALAQRVVHRGQQVLVVQDRIGMPHPGLLQIDDCVGHEAVTKRALRPAHLNHAVVSGASVREPGMGHAATFAAAAPPLQVYGSAYS